MGDKICLPSQTAGQNKAICVIAFQFFGTQSCYCARVPVRANKSLLTRIGVVLSAYKFCDGISN